VAIPWLDAIALTKVFQGQIWERNLSLYECKYPTTPWRSLTVVKSRSLTVSAMSRTMCPHDGVHSEKSAISLSSMGLRFPTRARFESLGSGNQSDPTISSITYCDHDYFFELPPSRERDAQSLRR
jgi:hypothetical protein